MIYNTLAKNMAQAMLLEIFDKMNYRNAVFVLYHYISSVAKKKVCVKKSIN